MTKMMVCSLAENIVAPCAPCPTVPAGFVAVVPPSVDAPLGTLPPASAGTAAAAENTI